MQTMQPDEALKALDVLSKLIRRADSERLKLAYSIAKGRGTGVGYPIHPSLSQLLALSKLPEVNSK